MQSSQPLFDLSVPNWNQIEQIQITDNARQVEAHLIVFPTNAGDLTIQTLKTGIRLRLGEQDTPDYQMLVNAPQVVACDLQKGDDSSRISFGDWQLEISHTPFAFTLTLNGKTVQKSPTDGHFVRRYRLPPLARLPEGWLISFDLDENEPVYGLGEKWSGLNKRGQLLRSYNHDALGVNAEISYKNTPFAWSTRGWGVFIHTPAPVTHSVGYAPWSQRTYATLVEDDSLDLFIFTGETGAELIGTYTEMTGRSPMPPLWSLGVILSKAYYRDVPELLETAAKVREEQMPCDVITLDGRAWQDTDTRFAFEWDPKRFDDPADVVRQLKDKHFRICIWEYPLVSVHNPLFNEMAEKGWLLKHKLTGETFRYRFDQSAFGEVLTPLPESGIVDFTHPEAYAFWRDQHKALFDLGIDMIKADFGEQVEDDNMLAHNGDTGRRLHNVYSLLYNRCVYEAAEKYSQTQPFLFSRSAWTGSQRYPSQWGGDPQADWGGLAGSIRGALSWGMSGAPFYATDVGGFYKDTRDPELFVRWTQAAVFSAHMRLHGIGQREPWSYGAEAEAAANRVLKLRYRLLPYIHRTLEQSVATGLPAMRAMVLAFPAERQAWAFENQFMFGEDMLVVPCLRAGGQVEYYLPKGRWRRFPSGETIDGGDVLSEQLALDQMAVFVRDNASIPLGPAIEYTGALKEDIEISYHWPQDEYQ